MIKAKLGKTIDIHTGGIDHIPVHHTNEIAQSEAANNAPLAKYWLHCAHLLTDGTKISKSLGNVHTLADLEKKGFTPLDFRMLALQSHYRTESNFTWDNLSAAHNRLQHWRQVAALRWQLHDTLVDDDEKDTNDVSAKLLATPHAMLEALDDDLNTPEALRIIEEAFDSIEAAPHADIQQDALHGLLSFIDDVLGLKLCDSTPDINEDQKLIIVERERVREAKDWPSSDKLRDELAKQGIILNDTAHGVRWSWM